jgi:hypothetical protein
MHQKIRTEQGGALGLTEDSYFFVLRFRGAPNAGGSGAGCRGATARFRGAARFRGDAAIIFFSFRGAACPSREAARPPREAARPLRGAARFRGARPLGTRACAALKLAHFSGDNPPNGFGKILPGGGGGAPGAPRAGGSGAGCRCPDHCGAARLITLFFGAARRGAFRGAPRAGGSGARCRGARRARCTISSPFLFTRLVAEECLALDLPHLLLYVTNLIDGVLHLGVRVVLVEHRSHRYDCLLNLCGQVEYGLNTRAQ